MRTIQTPLILLAVATSLSAQQPVTRQQAVEAALARGPRVVLGRSDTATATALLRSARAFENPILSASYTRDTPQQHLALELPLDLPWQRGARVRAAAMANASAGYRFDRERAAARFDAEAAYTRALAAETHRRLSLRTALDADSLLRMARARREAGETSELDVELAIVNAGQLANTAADDSVAATEALLDLQQVMGLASDRVLIGLADSLVPPPAPSSGPADSVTLAVASASASFRSAEAALALERRSIFGVPALQLGFDTRDPGGQAGLLPVIGLSLPLPLFNAHGGAIALAAAERDRAQAELELARRASDAELARARRALDLGAAKVRRDSALVASARRVEAMALLAYGEGAVALPNVLEAGRSAREAQGRYVDDLAAANIADAALRFLSAQGRAR
jgi:cobalt-zinc-cadmium efflux system outer membrane protein